MTKKILTVFWDLLHLSIVLAICMPKILKFGGDLTKFWQKQVGSFLAHPVRFKKHVMKFGGLDTSDETDIKSKIARDTLKTIIMFLNIFIHHNRW